MNIGSGIGRTSGSGGKISDIGIHGHFWRLKTGGGLIKVIPPNYSLPPSLPPEPIFLSQTFYPSFAYNHPLRDKVGIV